MLKSSPHQTAPITPPRTPSIRTHQLPTEPGAAITEGAYKAQQNPKLLPGDARLPRNAEADARVEGGAAIENENESQDALSTEDFPATRSTGNADMSANKNVPAVRSHRK